MELSHIGQNLALLQDLISCNANIYLVNLSHDFVIASDVHPGS